MAIRASTISSPISTLPSTTRPLRVSLSIASLNRKEGQPFASTSADPFDELDDERGGYAIEMSDLEEEKEELPIVREEPVDGMGIRRKYGAGDGGALSVKSHVLHRQLGDITRGDDLPDWLRATRGTVSAMAAARVEVPIAVEGEQLEGALFNGGKGKKTESVFKVMVGCENGEIWMFEPQEEEDEGNGAVVGLGVDHSNLLPGSSEPSSPISPNGNRSMQVDGAPFPSPGWSINSSSNDISTISSPTLSDTSTHDTFPTPPRSHSHARSRHANHRGDEGSRNRMPSTTTIRRIKSNESITSSLTVSSSMTHGMTTSSNRPRKASATVSVSTTTPTMDYDPTFSLSSPAPASTYITSPNSASRLSSPPPPQNRRGHKSKSSITTGIGIWEHDSGLEPAIESSTSTVEEEPVVPIARKKLSNLVPSVRVCVGGEGPIVALQAMEGTQFGLGEGGTVFVSLRRNGLLSIHSVIDGRVLGSADVGSHASVDRSGAIHFVDFQVVKLSTHTTVFCYGPNDIGLVAVNLETLLPEIVAETSSLAGTFASFTSEEGSLYLMNAPSTTLPPRLVLRQVLTYDLTLSNESLPTSKVIVDERVLGSAVEAGELPGLVGEVRGIRSYADDKFLAFDDEGILMFALRDKSVVSLGYLPIEGVSDIIVDERHSILIRHKSLTDLYTLDISGDKHIYHFTLISSIPFIDIDCISSLPYCKSSSTFLIARTTPEGTRSLAHVSFPCQSRAGVLPSTSTLYEVPVSATTAQAQVTAVVTVESHSIILGFNSGDIYQTPLSSLDAGEFGAPKAQLWGSISLLEIVELGSLRMVVAGSADGMVGIWNLPDWTLVGTWKLFASPVTHIVPFKFKPTSKLNNTIAFVSANSPIALVGLSPPRLLFVLPGTKSPVQIIATKADEILVVYGHGLARVCDVAGRELRRSMDFKTASSVLAEVDWKTWFSREKHAFDKSYTSPYTPLLDIDLRNLVDSTAQSLPWAENHYSNVPTGQLSTSKATDAIPEEEYLSLVRLLLSKLVTFRFDKDSDDILRNHLQVSEPTSVFPSAIQSRHSFSFAETVDVWTVSAVATAQRLLQIVCLLRVFLNYPELERYASQAIVFYASFLADAVGPTFVAPALDVFTDYWLDASTEIQQAAQLLFGTYLVSSSDANIVSLVERWQDLLPARQTTTTVRDTADQAVLVIGLLVAEKFKLLSAVTLKDVSASIGLYLSQNGPPYHQAIAAELCTRGFEIWQNYVDAMVLLRQLFGLSSGRYPGTRNEVRNLARVATLHVATINTPLFMTTLSFDILNAHSAIDRNATIKLLGFMVRKKPLVLYSSLPRLAEAVVKSLDPSVTALRETVQQAATVILNELVRTYPSIDFHGGSQRLAVGTHEGATIIYDLKTGTRLYVLEGHRKSITALSFSPDGRRLVSVSLEESKVLVWKVGGGYFSLFTTGTVPRQGSGGTTVPFKTLDFNVGEEGLMTTAATLEWVAFEWPSERTTRLKIRESNLTFSV